MSLSCSFSRVWSFCLLCHTQPIVVVVIIIVYYNGHQRACMREVVLLGFPIIHHSSHSHHQIRSIVVAIPKYSSETIKTNYSYFQSNPRANSIYTGHSRIVIICFIYVTLIQFCILFLKKYSTFFPNNEEWTSIS